jgi:hypothetical protein
MRLRMLHSWLLSAAVLALLSSSEATAADPPRSLELLPREFTLTGPELRQRLLLEELEQGRPAGQVTEGVVFETSDPAVARVEEGSAVPVSNGRARITARAGSRTAAAEVTVTGMEKPFLWSFRNHVQSVLTKAGCNSGACHGAIAGKNGFHLSLRGYDPEGDFLTLTRQARGRRIVPQDPGRSLMLEKPTGAVPHKGGLRFETGSLEYRVLSEWIASGTPPPAAADPRIDHVEVLPRQMVLRPGLTQELVVRAHFTDGHAEDVTRWAKYTGTDGSVAQVEDSGRVRVVGPGEGAITVWYLSRIVIATVSVPYPNQVPPQLFLESPRKNFIDELVLAKLKALNLPPSPPATDGEFLRRAFLDTIGLLPTAEESRVFVSDPSPGKRDALVERLLQRPEFIDYWAYKWSDLLLVSSENLSRPAVSAYYNWIRNQVAANTPWDKLVERLVSAQGSTLENGAANFFVLHPDPPSMAETTSVAFLGMSIGCARCHNHPLEKWTNAQYYGMASLFARVRTKDGPGEGNRIVFCAPEGELVQPLSGRPQPPCPLEGEPLPFDSPGDRRLHLASWLTSPKNPYFSRAITNRVWANFLGVGLVENVDDLRMTNPSSNEELLSAAAGFLAERRFDLKELMRAILKSSTYQRSSRSLPGNAADRRFYSRFYPRRLMAEVLLDGFSEVTGAPTPFPGYPQGWRALQLPDSNVASYFLKSFGRADRLITCECERTAQPSMAQVLHISNGDTLNQKLSAKGNRLERLVAESAPDEKVVEEAYLAALSRYPTPEEKEKLLQALSTAGGADRRPLIEDLYWSLLSSKEFLFNH